MVLESGKDLHQNATKAGNAFAKLGMKGERLAP